MTPEAAHTLVVETLVRCRTLERNATLVADALIAAELAGQGGHGLRRVPSYAGQALTGKVDGFAVPAAETVRPGVLRIDAAHGFAYPALELAMAALPGMAAAQGVAVGAVHRSHHAGVAGWFCERLARQGLAALMFANTPAAIAPPGGVRPLFGTNPIAFAAPTAGAEPVVVDLSLSTVARGKIMAAAQKGEAIPPDWATDAAGRATTDPKAALSGMMAPVGGAKGAALALMVEILAASVTGANHAAEASSFFEAVGKAPGTGQLLIALDPVALGGPEALDRIAGLIAGFEDNGAARVPGRRRQALAERKKAEGLTLDPKLAAEIDALGR